MGDVLVSALVKDLVGRLTSLAVQEFGLLRGLEDDISSLKKDYEWIEAVLQDAQEKHIKENTVKLWLKELRSASLEAENVLDDVSTEVLLQRLHKQRVKYRVRAFFSFNHNKFMSHVRIAHKVKDIRKKLDDIASNRLKLGLKPSDVSHVNVDVVVEIPSRETSSLILDSSSIFGRDEEMEMVIEKICNNGIGKYENGEVLVYGIWGMGGLGKTTLAQLVYNHEMVNQYFELKCWVYVSENFEIKEIIKGIIESINKCGCTITRLDTLQNTLKDKLKEKKFLIVLDDVWIEEDEKAKWDELSKTLSCGREGSIVVMTTRCSRTSQMMAKVDELQHKLECLSKEDSWLLFKKFAFAQGRERDDTNELEPIGMEIVEKCKGLPLAVKTLGSLMWSKKCTIDWEYVKNSNIWELHENNILPALKVSYDNLLPHIKRCFAYCCLFPKGYELKKDEVITLWLSNGFIPPRGDISLYYIGEEIFNCLVWRSFFQVSKVYEVLDDPLYAKTVLHEIYRMHDLMHDMARHVMGDDCLVIEPAKEVILSNKVLHLSSSFLLSPQDLRKLTSLRSILILKKVSYISQICNKMYIRVLHFTAIPHISILPASICKLKHLRYLNLSHSKIQVLPESIIYFQNLQVLLLFGCKELYKLPEGLRYMTNLQHLDIRSCYSLLHFPSGVKKLTGLRILPYFPLHKTSGAKIGELGDLNLLERELVIGGLENVGGLNEAESANLICKTNLSVLELQWSKRESSQREMFAHDEEVLNGLEPSLYLKELVIFNYIGNIISPNWMVKLSNLVEIAFKGCSNCLSFSALGRLPKLRVISMKVMDSLKCFHEDDNMLDDTANVFPSLQKLIIYQCSSLVSLPCSLPKLEVLQIDSCGELVSLPCNLPKLEVLYIYYCGKIVSLPSNLPKLEVLDISYCWNIVSLPDDLPNIKGLYLLKCVRLHSLPNDIKSFKELEEITIIGCEHLLKKYGKNVGEDWPKISHVPTISIEE